VAIQAAKRQEQQREEEKARDDGGRGRERERPGPGRERYRHQGLRHIWALTVFGPGRRVRHQPPRPPVLG
jgi:hypothetical protein